MEGTSTVSTQLSVSHKSWTSTSFDLPQVSLIAYAMGLTTNDLVTQFTVRRTHLNPDHYASVRLHTKAPLTKSFPQTESFKKAFQHKSKSISTKTLPESNFHGPLKHIKFGIILIIFRFHVPSLRSLKCRRSSIGKERKMLQSSEFMTKCPTHSTLVERHQRVWRRRP